MKNFVCLCFAALFLMSVSVTVKAQDDLSRLNRIADDVACHLKDKMPDWKRRRVTPISGSENAIIEQWISGPQAVIHSSSF